ncbi:hypothetical protein C8N25_106142 [Algoriphagus antarcticus]|uniref:Uncharacterized protein n=1 Tax=Algoriphagus antarcticus TaxID=238540 RepID=A0A3E0DYW1_9BACT|nr:hypothetical protein C8N25_106142 [Algoriphagus antarcticus]
MELRQPSINGKTAKQTLLFWGINKHEAQELKITDVMEGASK